MIEYKDVVIDAILIVIKWIMLLFFMTTLEIGIKRRESFLIIAGSTGFLVTIIMCFVV